MGDSHDNIPYRPKRDPRLDTISDDDKAQMKKYWDGVRADNTKLKKRIAELEQEVKDAFYDGRDARERAEQAEKQLEAKTELINNIKTCCSMRSVTAFLDRYEQALGENND